VPVPPPALPRLLLALAVALLAVAAAAPAAGAQEAQRFTGTVQGVAFVLERSASGRTLLQGSSVPARMRCADGRRRTARVGLAGVRVRRDGRFARTVGRRGSRRFASVRGRFAGERVSGTVSVRRSVRARGGAVRCAARGQRFAAARDTVAPSSPPVPVPVPVPAPAPPPEAGQTMTVLWFAAVRADGSLALPTVPPGGTITGCAPVDGIHVRFAYAGFTAPFTATATWSGPLGPFLQVFTLDGVPPYEGFAEWLRVDDLGNRAPMANGVHSVELAVAGRRLASASVTRAC